MNGEGRLKTVKDPMERPRTLFAGEGRLGTGVLKRSHFRDGEVTGWSRDWRGWSRAGYGHALKTDFSLYKKVVSKTFYFF